MTFRNRIVGADRTSARGLPVRAYLSLTLVGGILVSCMESRASLPAVAAQPVSALEQERMAYCADPPWTVEELRAVERRAAASASERGSTKGSLDGGGLGSMCSLKTSCSQLHREWLRARDDADVAALRRTDEEIWRRFDKLDCGASPFGERWDRALYQRVWLGLEALQSREDAAERLQALRREEASALRRFDEALARATEAALDQAAGTLGFTERRLGLRAFLEHVRDTGLPLGDARKVLIHLSNEDDALRVVQVLGSTALVADEDLRIFVDADKARLYEGSPVSALGASSYQVVGTRSYDSLSGKRQAFVLSRVEELSAGLAPLLAVAAALSRDGFVAFAEYSNGALAECSVIQVEAFEKIVQNLGATGFSPDTRRSTSRLILEGSCAQTFSRRADASCTSPRGASITVYPRPTTFQGIDEADCEGMGGAWRPASTSNVP